MTPMETVNISSEVFSNMFLYLLWMTIKSAVIFGLGILLTTVLRRTTAVGLHLVLCCAMFAALLIPVLTIVFPQWQLFYAVDLPSQLLPEFIVNSQEAVVVGNSVPSDGLPWQFWALAVWLVGVLFILGRTVIGLIATGRLVNRAGTVVNPALTALKEKCRKQVGIRRKVRLAESSAVSSPFVWGMFRSVIIMPEAAEHWRQSNLEYVILHELAHIKRLDALWYLLATVTSAIYWINPLVWMTRKRLIIEGEKTCDDYVLNSGTDRTAYAQHLLKVLDLLRAKRQIVPVGVGMARRSHMEGRLMSILSDRKRSAGLKRSVMVIAIVLTMIFALPLAGVQVSAGEKSTSVDEQNHLKLDEFVKVDAHPEMTSQQAPEYPESAKENGIEGVVWVKVLVDTTGQVIKAVVGKSSGNEALDEAAIKAAYNSKFKPAQLEGKPVMAWVSYKVSFVLDDYAEKKEKGDG